MSEAVESKAPLWPHRLDPALDMYNWSNCLVFSQEFVDIVDSVTPHTPRYRLCPPLSEIHIRLAIALSIIIAFRYLPRPFRYYNSNYQPPNFLHTFPLPSPNSRTSSIYLNALTRISQRYLRPRPISESCSYSRYGHLIGPHRQHSRLTCAISCCMIG